MLGVNLGKKVRKLKAGCHALAVWYGKFTVMAANFL
jgi:hypothetical protein